MTLSNVYMFPVMDRILQVRRDRLDAGTDALSNYLVIIAGKIEPGKKPLATVFDLNAERAKRNS